MRHSNSQEMNEHLTIMQAHRQSMHENMQMMHGMAGNGKMGMMQGMVEQMMQHEVAQHIHSKE